MAPSQLGRMEAGSASAWLSETADSGPQVMRVPDQVGTGADRAGHAPHICREESQDGGCRRWALPASAMFAKTPSCRTQEGEKGGPTRAEGWLLAGAAQPNPGPKPQGLPGSSGGLSCPRKFGPSAKGPPRCVEKQERISTLRKRERSVR